MALQVYKILGQLKLTSTNTLTTLYTVPSTATAQVVVTANNNNTSSATYGIAVIPNGETIADKNYSYRSNGILSHSTETSLTFSLGAGDVIQVVADDTDVVFQAYGVEIYTPAQGVYFDVVEYGTTSTVRLYNLEQNLNYLNYVEDESSLKIGFKGYGDNDEVSIDFPSPGDRNVFVSLLELARLYGTAGGGVPVESMIYLGSTADNSGEEVTTTSTSTTTTTTSSETTTTTTAGTTTTTTAGPPVLRVIFDVYPNNKATGQVQALYYASAEPTAEGAEIASSTATSFDETYTLTEGSYFSVNVITTFNVTYSIDKTVNGQRTTLYSTFAAAGPVYGGFNPNDDGLDPIGSPILAEAGVYYTATIKVV